MTDASMPTRASADALTRYYFLRAGVAAAWVAAAFTVGAANAAVGGVLLALYPAWDAVANLGDARANGGLRANRLQALNVFVSAAVAVAVALALRIDMHLVLAVFGAWAVLAGVLQLAVGVTRWRAYGAQWAMVLSGAQSALAGGFFVMKAGLPAVPTAATVAPYAAFGAFYFLLSAIALTWKARRSPHEPGGAGPPAPEALPFRGPGRYGHRTGCRKIAHGRRPSQTRPRLRRQLGRARGAGAGGGDAAAEARRTAARGRPAGRGRGAGGGADADPLDRR